MVTVKIDKYDLLELLLDRVEFWNKDTDVKKLYEVYYSELIDNGCFNGAELDIKCIVDNDYINNYQIYDSIDDIMRDFNASEDEARLRVVAECDGLYLVSTCAY